MTKNLAKFGLVLALSAGLSAAAANSVPASPKAITHKSAQKAPKKAIPMVGSASCYGKQFHGRTTASGDPYDMFQFTAASRTLPLGSYVKVTNLRNRKWVIVKVNDRGPYVGNRIMDVSYGAAQMLNFRARGIEKVKLEVVEPTTIAQADITSLE